MKISKEEVKHVADLARLHMSEDELVQMTQQLDTILAYVEKLEELDTTGVVPTTHAFSITNAFRDDTVKPSLEQKRALGVGSETTNDSFVVPRVI